MRGTGARSRSCRIASGWGAQAAAACSRRSRPPCGSGGDGCAGVAGDSPGGQSQSPVRRYSTDLHCANCDIHYRDPTPSLFSFNSPLGACDTCRGFGRVIGVDYGLVVPDPTRTLRGGAVRPWQTESYRECQDDLVRFARKRAVPLDTPWGELTEEQRRWVIDGEGPWERKVWYGVRRFFAWLETKSYKMHIRVLLSKYRSYTPCDGLRRCAAQARGPAVAARRRRVHAGTQRARCDAAADRARRAISSRASCCLRRSTRRPTCCWERSARGSTSWCAWASAT